MHICVLPRKKGERNKKKEVLFSKISHQQTNSSSSSKQASKALGDLIYQLLFPRKQFKTQPCDRISNHNLRRDGCTISRGIDNRKPGG
jgi:hypothetical protein